MIRDPSDGSTYDLPKHAVATSDTGPVIDTSTSGLPITKAKADYLARLEDSREWLKEYVRSTINA